MSAFRLSLAVLLAAMVPVRAETWILPGVADVPGKGGTRFESAVWLTNPGLSAASVSMRLLSGTGATFPPAALTVAAGTTLRLDNPVRRLAGSSGEFGALLLDADATLLVRGSTANVADAAGTYGLGLFAASRESLLLEGEVGHGVFLSNSGNDAEGDRTNLGVVLHAPGSAVRLTLFDQTGFVRGTRELRSETPRVFQLAAAELAGDPDLRLARVELRVLRGEATGYTVVVDNVTGDGLLSPIERPAHDGTAWLLDGVARTAGAGGTRWTTDVRLQNPGLSPLDVTLTALPSGRSMVRTVPARGLTELRDVLTLLGLPDGSAGALRLSAASPFLPVARTANRSPSRPGAFSALVRPVPGDGLTPAPRTLVFSGLRSDDAFRTNLALLAGNAPAAGELTLRDGDGHALATTPFGLSPSEWTQRGLASWFPAATLPSDARVEVRISSGALDAYASVIDNGTGDPVIVPGVLAPARPCSVVRLESFTSTASTVALGESVTFHYSVASTGAFSGELVPSPQSFDATGSTSGSFTHRPSASGSYRLVLTSDCGTVASEAIHVEVAPEEGVAFTESGPVEGVVEAATVAFRGLPFAAPPIGTLRLRPPVAPTPWSELRDASAFGAVCPQLTAEGAFTGDEDCLTLNVYRPRAPGAPRPMLVFLHGGANFEGASSLAVYDGRPLAAAGDVIVATVNYRLGALGFLAHPSLTAESPRASSGNYGLLDQIAALSWLRRNAESLGADPERVLVFGQSAGAYDVCALVASPLAKGLFRSALLESGACASVPLASIEAFGETVARAAGCGPVDTAACLRDLSARALVTAVPGQSPVYANTGQLYGYGVDGFVLSEDPLERIRAGRHNRVPVVIGTTLDETALATPVVFGPFDYQANVLASFGPVVGALVLFRYPLTSYPSAQKALVALTSDSRFICPTRRLARALAAGQDESVFRYSFDHALELSALRAYGAYHGLELPFVFQTFSAYPTLAVSPAERALSAAMGRYWTRFAATHDPNDAGDPSWTRYEPARDPYLSFDTRITSGEGLRRANCDFWDSF